MSALATVCFFQSSFPFSCVTSVTFCPLLSNIRLKAGLGVKFVPSLVTLPKVINVTIEPTVCAIAIFDAHLDDFSNETTVTMFVRSLTFLRLIQNRPPSSNDIGMES